MWGVYNSIYSALIVLFALRKFHTFIMAPRMVLSTSWERESVKKRDICTESTDFSTISGKKKWSTEFRTAKFVMLISQSPNEC